jgi:hypothetical protein
MTSMSFETPSNIGTRDLVRAWLDAIITSDIEGSVVEVDCAPLKSPTPSFFDELLRILVVERDAKTVTLRNVNQRAQALAFRSANNRHIQDRLAILDPIQDPKDSLIKRILR